MHPRWHFVVVALLGCGPSPPTDIVGEYFVNPEGSIGGRCVTTATPDADPFDSYWKETRFFSGQPHGMHLTSDGALTEVSFHGGAVADYLDTFVGATSFMGSVRDGQFDATIVGTKTFERGACAFTVDARLEVTFTSLLYSTDLTVPMLSGAIVSTPRPARGDCGFAVCPEHAFVTGVEATRLP
ncbi:MAG TPA: hypothetical protein VLM85_15740 [Polyangiaceae bacterium]|nr:hypothetical protein [Polyangiaceae bacterium]